ncbi:unnamed protein product [Adineta steineri]|uniref:Uncharacterized protein n=1 Tax=Adineta steineri TaxID=433720 RepID=A0A815JVI4_9BILA|nr:unnamed protein product [Adineta steineri]
MHKSKVVNTKRERRSSNNKNQNNNHISKQPSQTQSFATLGALVTGLTSTTPANMSDEINHADTLVIQQQPPPIDINNQPNGNHSPSKNFQVKNGHDESTPFHLDHGGVDSGVSSEITQTQTETEKPHVSGGDDELSSTSGTSSAVMQTDNSQHQRDLSPTSGVIVPEEKRVTDRVKVFEAVAKNGNKKKSNTISSSFSMGDHKQISPTSVENFDSQSINETKSSKNKSKKTSLKKQIQNLLKIDKPTSIPDDFMNIDEQQLNGKKNKKDNVTTFKPLEIQIPNNTEENNTSSTVSKLIDTFQANDIEQPIVVPQLNTPPPPPPPPQPPTSTTTTSHQPPIQSENSTSASTEVPQSDTSADIVPTESPKKSVSSAKIHSPMSSGVGESVKTSTHSVTIEKGTRNRSPMQRHAQNETSNNNLSYSLLNQSTNIQVTDNLREQHQREKQELSELNDRFRGYLDRVKILESKNSKLTNQLEDIAKTWGSASQAIVSQYSGSLDRLRQEVNESMLNEADIQTRLRRSHYDIDNYRSLIHDETLWNNRQEEKREQLKLEYEHSCVELTALQRSYKQVDDQLKILLKQREEYLEEINQLNEQSYKATLDRIKLDLEVQTLREEIPFLNDVHAHLISEFEQLKPTNGIDTQLFYRQELEKAIRDIRRDFDTLHSAQRKEMEDYYTVKIEEIQNNARKLVPLQSRQDDLMKMSEQIKSTKFELSDTQKLLIHEKDNYKELQERLAKLEEEYNYLRHQREDANDNINKELSSSHDRIQQLSGEIDTILQSNITLESEINIYRRLLDSETNRLTQQPVEQILSPEPTPPSFGSELGKVFNKKIKKGPIAIKDCAPDGKCITLENSSMDKDVDVSNWTLKRRVEGSPEISYTIPYGLIIKHGNDLKIYARSAQNAHHRPPSQVVNDQLDSWGMGTACETKLFNEQGEEKASHSQKIVFGSESSRHLP